MEVFFTRTFLFTVLPVVLGAGVMLFDPSARGGSATQKQCSSRCSSSAWLGAESADSSLTCSSPMKSPTQSVGTGSPFQLEVGFANLAIGLLGAIAAERRDGFREATVIAATVFAVGATFVHIRDIVDTGNLAPGNTIQNVPNLLRPALLIFFLRRSRSAGLPSGDGRAFDDWRASIVRASVVGVIIVSTAFAIGFATDQSALVSAFATLVAAAGFGLSIRVTRPASSE